MPPLKLPRPEGLPRATREENASRGPHTPLPPRPEPEEEHTLHGSPAPPPGPPRPKLDSREITTETLLHEYKQQADKARAEKAARQVAEQEASELRIQLAAAESGVTAQGPKLSLGSAKWWVLVIAALAAAPQLREWVRPSISAAQLEAFRGDVQQVAKGQAATVDALAVRDAADAKRWTMQLAFLCSQGFRARGADCAAAEAYADFQAQPLKPNGAPQWKANTTWPAVPVPKD